MKRIVLGQKAAEPSGKENEGAEANVFEMRGYRAAFSRAKGDMVSLESGGAGIKLRYAAKGAADVAPLFEGDGRTVVYEGVEEGVDLRYELEDRRLKESLVIKGRRDEYSFGFEAEIGGLEPSYNEGDNTLELKAGGRVAYRIQAPFMVDSNGAESKKCSYEIEEAHGGRLAIKLVCDAGWINADERAFPVIVDPTIEMPISSALARAYQGSSYNNAPSDDEVFVGYKNEDDNPKFYSFSVDLDFSYLPDVGPNKRAFFEMPVNYNMFNGDEEIVVTTGDEVVGVFKQNALLSDGVMRIDITKYVENQSSMTLYFEMACDYSLGRANKPYYKSMTLESGVHKASLRVKDQDGTERARVVVESKEEGDACAEYDAGVSGVTSVNIQTGRFWHRVPGLTISDGPLTLAVDHLYDSKDNSQKAYGRGWRPTVSRRLRKETESDGRTVKVTYTDDAGRDHVFTERWFYRSGGGKTYVNRDDVTLSEDNELVCRGNNEKVEYELTNDEGYSYVSLASLTNYDARKETYRYYIRYNGFKKPVFRDKTNYLQFVYVEDGTTYYVANSNVESRNGEFVTKVNGEDKHVYLSKEYTRVVFSGDGATATIYYGTDKRASNVKLERYAVYENADSGLYTTSEIENLEYEKNQAKYALGEIDRAVTNDKAKEYSVLSSIHGVDLGKAIADYNSDPNDEDNADKIADGKAKIALYSEFIHLENELISAYEQQLSAERNAYFATRSFNGKIKQQKESANDYVVEKDGSFVLFDGYGRMAGLADEKEHKIEISYDEDSNIKEIKSEGERIVFNYNNDNKLSSMRKSNGDYARFYYGGECLHEIHCNGRKTKIEYDRGLVVYSDVNDEIIVDNVTSNTIKVKKYVEPGTIDAKKEFGLIVDRTLVQNDKYEYSSDYTKTKITDRIYNRVTTVAFDLNGEVAERVGPDGALYANYLKGKLISSAEIKNDPNILFSKSSFSLSGNVYSLPSQAKRKYMTKTNAYCLKVVLGDPTGGIPTNPLILAVSYAKGGETYNFKQSFYSEDKRTLVLPFFMKGEVSGLTASVTANVESSVDVASYVEDVSIVEAEKGLLQEYDEEDRLWKIKNNDGKTTYLAFDDKLPIKVEFKDWDGKAVTTWCEYDDQGRLVHSVASDGNVEDALYLDGGKRVEKASYNLKDASLARRTVSEYDEKTGTYIEKGAIKGADGEYPAAKTVFYPGTVIAKTSADLSGGRTEYAIDPRTKNVMAWSKDIGGIRSHVSYSYNRDFLTSVKSDSMEVEYTYDGRRRLKTAKVKGRQKEAIKNTYRDNVTIVDGDGKSHPHGSSVKSVFDGAYEATSEMDEDGRLINLTQIGAEGSFESHYNYNDGGDLLGSITTRKGDGAHTEETARDYDSAGRVTSQTKIVSEENGTGEKSILSFQYDGDLLSKTELTIDGLSIHSTTYSYNDEKLLEKESINKDYACEYRYDALKREERSDVLFANKLSLARSLSYLQQDGATLDLIAEEAIRVSLPDGGLMEERRAYSYDVQGRITEIAVDDKKASYSYDGLGRLVKERNETLGMEISYSYDRLGNMLSKRTYALDSGFLKSEDQLTYSDDAAHALSSWNGKRVESDALGRITSLDGVSFSWNSDGTLAFAKDASAGKTEYLYDSNGIRRLKRLPSGEEVRYVTDGSRILSESRGGKRIDYVYAKDGLMGFYYAGEPYLYERGAQGDIIRVYDRSGSVAAEYAYDAYGNCEVLADVGGIASLNPFRYRGYYFDAETGLYYLNARYYDPRLGRFLSPDSLSYLDPSSAAGTNLFAYCQCDPVNNVDPSGHMPDWAKWLIGGLVILGLGVATFFTGGAAGVILGAAFYGAVTGAVSGAVVSGLVQGFMSLAAGSDFWDGFSHGAADGFMWGAIIGGATSAATAGINIATGGVKIIGSAQKTGYLFHRFTSNVQAGKFALQVGKYSTISLNRSLKSTGLEGGLRPDVLAIGSHGAKVIEVVSGTQTIFDQTLKIQRMASMNPELVGIAVDWLLGGWFYL